MFSRDSLLGSILYQVARLSPAVASILVGYIHLSIDPELGRMVLVRLIAFIGVVVVWSMAEGVLMLWLKAKLEDKRDQNGYIFVGVMLFILLMPLLHTYRVRVSQTAFLLLIAALSLRGASRSGWEQGRPIVGFLAAFGGASLIAVSSFFATAMVFTVDTAAVAIAFGAGVAAVEAGWNAESLRVVSGARWILPLFRVFMLLGPIALSAMVIGGRLPLIYAATLLPLMPASRTIAKIGTSGPLEQGHFAPIAGSYMLFLGILVGCRLYVVGVFS